MEKIKDWLYPLIIISVIVLGIMFLGFFAGNTILPDEPTLGSVASGSEYHATSTSQMNAGAAWTAREQRVVATTTPSGTTPSGDARTTSITLGSVMVASSSIDHLTIRNATSTLDIASTTIVIFDNDNNVSPGTYVFDIVLDRGLVLDFGSVFNGSYVITWK